MNPKSVIVWFDNIGGAGHLKGLKYGSSPRLKILSNYQKYLLLATLLFLAHPLGNPFAIIHFFNIIPYMHGKFNVIWLKDLINPETFWIEAKGIDLLYNGATAKLIYSNKKSRHPCGSIKGIHWADLLRSRHFGLELNKIPNHVFHFIQLWHLKEYQLLQSKIWKGLYKYEDQFALVIYMTLF